tara:strand:+ start:171 stop:530 length:360 start_codon:yes stop_codon:yes gene_type:complete
MLTRRTSGLRYIVSLAAILAAFWLFAYWVDDSRGSNHYLFCAGAYLPSIHRPAQREMFEHYIEVAIASSIEESNKLTRESAKIRATQMIEAQGLKWARDDLSGDEVADKFMEIRRACAH